MDQSTHEEDAEIWRRMVAEQLECLTADQLQTVYYLTVKLKKQDCTSEELAMIEIGMNELFNGVAEARKAQ